LRNVVHAFGKIAARATSHVNYPLVGAGMRQPYHLLDNLSGREIPRNIPIPDHAINTIRARLRLTREEAMCAATARLKQKRPITARHCRASEFLRFDLLPVQRYCSQHAMKRLYSKTGLPAGGLDARFSMPPRMVNDVIEQDDFLVVLVPQRGRPVNRSEQVREELARQVRHEHLLPRRHGCRRL
jgi:hypothetical protein